MVDTQKFCAHGGCQTLAQDLLRPRTETGRKDQLMRIYTTADIADGLPCTRCSWRRRVPCTSLLRKVNVQRPHTERSTALRKHLFSPEGNYYALRVDPFILMTYFQQKDMLLHATQTQTHTPSKKWHAGRNTTRMEDCGVSMFMVIDQDCQGRPQQPQSSSQLK